MLKRSIRDKLFSPYSKRLLKKVDSMDLMDAMINKKDSLSRRYCHDRLSTVSLWDMDVNHFTTNDVPYVFCAAAGP